MLFCEIDNLKAVTLGDHLTQISVLLFEFDYQSKLNVVSRHITLLWEMSVVLMKHNAIDKSEFEDIYAFKIIFHR